MTSVIIVDDYKDVTNVLSEFLELYSIDVLGTGKNGKDAVELYEKLKPDIVIVDSQMPEFDGLYAIDNIRKINPLAKIIVLSGSTDGPMRKKITQSRADIIIEKPIPMKELVEVIKKFGSDEISSLKEHILTSTSKSIHSLNFLTDPATL